jgi:transcriptional regulator with XRE-family HTH domain
MITAGQIRAARALLGIDQRQLADLSGLSVPTIQRMEASGGVVRGNVDSLVKLIDALGIRVEIIGENATSPGGGVEHAGNRAETNMRGPLHLNFSRVK